MASATELGEVGGMTAPIMLMSHSEHWHPRVRPKKQIPGVLMLETHN